VNADALRHRPIFGGAFGNGRYELATKPCIAHGLHAVKFMVIEPHAGTVLAIAMDKREALNAARKLLRAGHAIDQAAGWRGSTASQGALWPEHDLPAPKLQKVVTRRRAEVFRRSDGRCHYCGAALSLDGAWHVEHQMPRALGGDDNPVNLVAACAGCNLEKGDRTALEFVASQRHAEA